MLEMGVGGGGSIPLGGRETRSPQKNLNNGKERDAPGRSRNVYTEPWCISPGFGLRHHQDGTSWTPWTYPHMQNLWL